MKKQLIAAAIGLATSISVAQATIFDFSYLTVGGDTLAGQLDGTLQADNNTVVVSSILDFATFNGNPGPSLTYVESFAEFLGGPSADPLVTIDGSFMDMIACTDSADCEDGFLFSYAFDGGEGGEISFASGEAFGELFEPFNAANWSLTPTSVPEPATLALMGLGLAGLGAARRRKTVS